MKITPEEVEHVAWLARLELSPEEKTLFTRQLSDILTYVGQLSELDTTQVEPMSHAVQLHNVLREDVVEESMPRDEALSNAPSQQSGFFKVPKVLG